MSNQSERRRKLDKKEKSVKLLYVIIIILIILSGLTYIWYETELTKEELDAIWDDILTYHPKQIIKTDFVRWLVAKKFRIVHTSNLEHDVLASVVYMKYEGRWQLLLLVNSRKAFVQRDRASLERTLWHEYWHLYQVIERKVSKHVFLLSSEYKRLGLEDALLLLELELEAHEYECKLALYQKEEQAQPKYKIYQTAGRDGLKSYLARQFLGRYDKRLSKNAGLALMRLGGVRKTRR
jgi:hypothetical protein